MTRTKKTEQLAFEFKQHGGARPGSGRKRRSKQKRVAHTKREELKPRYPVHVVLPLCEGLPTLRRGPTHYVLRETLTKAANRPGFRLVHYSAMGNHLHLVCEADSTKCLSRGMQGLASRVARKLNEWWERNGTVFADRFHDTILRTPTQVRNALCYVLKNAHHHRLVLPAELDPFSSAEWFDGWSEPIEPSGKPNPFAIAKTWMLNVGWRLLGLIPIAPT